MLCCIEVLGTTNKPKLVPIAYPQLTEQVIRNLKKEGIVIDANHAIRGAAQAMRKLESEFLR